MGVQQGASWPTTVTRPGFGSLHVMPTDPDEQVETTPAAPEQVDTRSARAAKVAAAQRARGNSTGPKDRPRAPKTLKRL